MCTVLCSLTSPLNKVLDNVKDPFTLNESMKSLLVFGCTMALGLIGTAKAGAQTVPPDDLFGVTEYCPNQFAMIDPSNGSLNPLSQVGDSSFFFNVGASAVDSSTHRMFVIRSSGMPPTPHVASIDTQTGALTESPPLSRNLIFLRASVIPVIPFSAFTAQLEIGTGLPPSFELKASFSLGAGSNGINPLNEDVSLQIGAFSITIPAGSFSQDTKGNFKFEGSIKGVALEAKIGPLGNNRFEFEAEGTGLDQSWDTFGPENLQTPRM